jgi:integrase
MSNDMKHKYRMFRRQSGVYFIQDNETGKQQSLRTKNKVEAETLLSASNEANRQPFLNLQIARTYLMGTDPKMVSRTWQEVMEKIVSLKQGPTQVRWAVAICDRAYNVIRTLPLLETRADHFLKVLANNKSSTNVYLRRIHNFALAMDWLLKPIIPRKEWPKVVYGKKRAITWDEHQRIIAREGNPERRDFYELCWHLGGSQSDVADLHAEDADWEDSTIGYGRYKNRNRVNLRVKKAIIHFGEEVAEILKRLPDSGPLFPYLRTVRAGDRATEFHQRCVGLGIQGVSLHSYRYAWAERARKCGFPLRFAQEALGHNSKAIHAAYASKAEVKVPSLDAWEKGMKDKLVEFKPVIEAPRDQPTAQAPVAAVS